MVQQILRVTQDTVFKLRPDPVSQLSSEAVYNVAAGSAFEIESYAYAGVNGDFNGHIKFALANAALRGFNTWFVYRMYAQVEFDGKVVYPLEDQEVLPVLQVNQNTLLKRRPIDASALSADEIHEATRGQSFALQSYAYADGQGDFSNHIKLALRYSKDYIRGLNTWFAYEGHAYVEIDSQVVYPPEDPDTLVLRVTQDTVFKRRPLQSSSLSPDEIQPVSKDSILKLQSYAYADAQGDFDNHIKFALKYAKDYIRDFNTWYVYDRHARVERNSKLVYPRPAPSPAPSPTYSGVGFKLPGNSSTFYTDQPIIPGGTFTWGEATRDATRIPANAETVNNIIALARELQRARNQIGRPFRINSWYRPPAVNAAVGGVSNSQHLYGRAADIEIPGYSGRRAANAVMAWWRGGIGIYSHLPNLLHLDVGARRTWGI